MSNSTHKSDLSDLWPLLFIADHRVNPRSASVIARVFAEAAGACHLFSGVDSPAPPDCEGAERRKARSVSSPPQGLRCERKPRGRPRPTAGVRNLLPSASPLGAPPRRFLALGPCEFGRTGAFAPLIPRDFVRVRHDRVLPLKAIPRSRDGRRPKTPRGWLARHIRRRRIPLHQSERLRRRPRRAGLWRMLQIYCSKDKA